MQEPRPTDPAATSPALPTGPHPESAKINEPPAPAPAAPQAVQTDDAEGKEKEKADKNAHSAEEKAKTDEGHDEHHDPDHENCTDQCCDDEGNLCLCLPWKKKQDEDPKRKESTAEMQETADKDRSELYDSDVKDEEPAAGATGGEKYSWWKCCSKKGRLPVPTKASDELPSSGSGPEVKEQPRVLAAGPSKSFFSSVFSRTVTDVPTVLGDGKDKAHNLAGNFTFAAAPTEMSAIPHEYNEEIADDDDEEIGSVARHVNRCAPPVRDDDDDRKPSCGERLLSFITPNPVHWGMRAVSWLAAGAAGYVICGPLGVFKATQVTLGALGPVALPIFGMGVGAVGGETATEITLVSYYHCPPSQCCTSRPSHLRLDTEENDDKEAQPEDKKDAVTIEIPAVGKKLAREDRSPTEAAPTSSPVTAAVSQPVRAAVEIKLQTKSKFGDFSGIGSGTAPPPPELAPLESEVIPYETFEESRDFLAIVALGFRTINLTRMLSSITDESAAIKQMEYIESSVMPPFKAAVREYYVQRDILASDAQPSTDAHHPYPALDLETLAPKQGKKLAIYNRTFEVEDLKDEIRMSKESLETFLRVENERWKSITQEKKLVVFNGVKQEVEIASIKPDGVTVTFNFMPYEWLRFVTTHCSELTLAANKIRQFSQSLQSNPLSRFLSVAPPAGAPRSELLSGYAPGSLGSAFQSMYASPKAAAASPPQVAVAVQPSYQPLSPLSPKLNGSPVG